MSNTRVKLRTQKSSWLGMIISPQTHYVVQQDRNEAHSALSPECVEILLLLGAPRQTTLFSVIISFYPSYRCNKMLRIARHASQPTH